MRQDPNGPLRCARLLRPVQVQPAAYLFRNHWKSFGVSTGTAVLLSQLAKAIGRGVLVQEALKVVGGQERCGMCCCRSWRAAQEAGRR